MGKFGSTPTKVRGPLGVSAPAITYEGGTGASFDHRSELFLLAATSMVREDAFYEGAQLRDARLENLVRGITTLDPDWVRSFARFLRNDLQMRSASIVVAAEYVKAKGPNGRGVVDSVLQRPDEPGEMLGYWLATYGRPIPQPIKRGVADAVRRLYTQNAALKYDGQNKGLRLADVIELTHPRPKDEEQSALFGYLLDRRHHPGTATVPERLVTISNVNTWRSAGAPLPPPKGVTWEAFSSTQFPLRFYSAWKNVASLRWGPGLELALQHSLSNVPALSGRTLILVDRSGSMSGVLSKTSTLTRYEAAAVFGAALALRAADADLWAYDEIAERFPSFGPGASVLRVVGDHHPRGGTRTWTTVMNAYHGHDRIVILTDEQTADSDPGTISVPIYTFNLAGYGTSHNTVGRANRFTFGGGFSDACFKLLEVLDRRRNGRWPWE